MPHISVDASNALTFYHLDVISGEFSFAFSKYSRMNLTRFVMKRKTHYKRLLVPFCHFLLTSNFYLHPLVKPIKVNLFLE